MKPKKKLYLFVLVALISSLSCANKGEKKEGDIALDSEKTIKNTDDDILVGRAVKALGEHLNVDLDSSSADFTLLSVEEVDWSNPSLGCPKPGFFYPHVIVPGHLVSILYREKVYPVHMSDKRSTICSEDKIKTSENKKPIIKSKKLDDFKKESILIKTRKDFQEKTGIPNNEIKIITVKSAVWANSALGCPERGKVYNENKVKGFRIILEARGRQYTYHTDDDEKTMPCPNILPR